MSDEDEKKKALEQVPRPGAFAPKSLGELLEFAKRIADSALVPNEYRGRPQDIVVAVQAGAELGLSPLQSLISVSVINGKSSVWGDGALALVRASGLLEDFEEKIIRATDPRVPQRSGNHVIPDAENRAGYCRMQRRGQKTPIEQTFTVYQAKQAGLWGKRGPWTQYPDRMLIMRARGFALRDGFADALRGLITREEAGDAPTVEEQQKALESDLPWTTRLSERGKEKPVDIAGFTEVVEEPDLTPILEASIAAAATQESAAPNSDAVVVADDASGMNPPGSSSSSDDEVGAALSPPPDFDPVPAQWEDEPVLINQQDRRRFHACRTEGKHSEEDAKAWLLREYGVTSSKLIQQAWMGDICRRLKDPARLV